MTTIVSAQLGMLAAGHLCSRLQRLIPDWHWSCVAPHSVGDYHLLEPGVPLLVNGHDAHPCDADQSHEGRWIRLEILPHDTPFTAKSEVPVPHEAHIELRIAGTAPNDLAGLAELICTHALLAGAGAGPLARMRDTPQWHDAAAIDALSRQRLGMPLANPRAQSVVSAPAQHDRLPVLAVLTAAPLRPDWAAIAHSLQQGDPDGGWRITPDSQRIGDAKVAGRDCVISVNRHATGVPTALIEQALTHSFWLEPGPVTQALRAHAGHIAIACDLDTTRAQAPLVRQCAKAMAVVMAMLAGAAQNDSAPLGPFVGVLNTATLSLFASGQLPMLMAPMAGDEVPIALFVASRVSGGDGAPLSLASLGMYPFIGMEVVAQTHGTLEDVGEAVNRVLRYLLQHGPVIGDGDTMGDGSGKAMIRCHIREAPAGAPSETGPARALVLEFLP